MKNAAISKSKLTAVRSFLENSQISIGTPYLQGIGDGFELIVIAQPRQLNEILTDFKIGDASKISRAIDIIRSRDQTEKEQVIGTVAALNQISAGLLE